MATTTSPRVSTDQQLRVDTLTLVNPHALPNANANARASDLAAHPQARRVSSETQSQAHGRSSPSLRTITRRTPVPFLLEAFPVPPSHIPPSPGTPGNASIRNGSPLSSVNPLLTTFPPGSVVSAGSPTAPTFSPTSTCAPTTFASGSATTPNNPPPSLPPSAPLPPVPGPSPVTPDLFITRRSLQSVRSASPALSLAESQSRSQSRAEQLPRSSVDSNEHVRGRGRKGSLSSLRNLVVPSAREQSEVIQEEPTEEEPRPPAAAAAQTPISPTPVAEEKSDVHLQRDIPDILRPSVSRKTSTPLVRPPDDNFYVQDSIASIDMSDLNAAKYDNEAEPDDHASRPFPQFPPLPHSQQQCVANPLPTSATPRKPSTPSIYSTHVFPTAEDRESESRCPSPEISQIISATPRVRKSSSSRSRVSSFKRDRKESARSRKGSEAPPMPKLSPNMGRMMVGKRRGSAAGLSASGDDEVVYGTGEADESDSSIDLHTPLPHLMLRHGMLSPNSKLLPQSAVDPTRLSIASDFSLSSYLSNTSNVSLVSTTSTSSKHLKDSRDTPQRRVRHRDGKLLKGGIGLTTGLGWSDSEDEDAPSPLTRRLSTLVLTRRVSSSSVNSYRSSHSQPYFPHPLSRSISHSILREVDEYEAGADMSEFGYSPRDSAGSRSFPTRSKGISRVGSTHSVGSSSLGRYSTLSTSSSSAPAPGIRMRANSGSGSSSYGASASSKTNSFLNGNGIGTGLALCIPEHDDGVTPTRAAFERSNLAGTATDLPHTPSSTASSVSIPFPATPESTEDLAKSHPGYDKNKMLPPLPASGKGKYPSSLGLRSPAGALQRPRTYSNASSVSNNSVLGVPASNPDGSTSRGPSPVPGIPRPSIGGGAPRPLIGATPRPSIGGTPRPSIGGTPRPSIGGTPRPSLSGGVPRPSLNGATPRPSLAIPRPSLSASPRSSFSAVPRPITPSSAPPSANGTTSPGYGPRPLKLVPRSATLPLSSSSLNTSPNIHSDQAHLSQSPEKPIQPGEQPPRPGQVLTYNRNVHDQLKLRALSPNGGYGPAHVMPISPGGTQTLLIPSSSSGSNPSSALSTPLTSPVQSTGGESPKPKPRTGTGMVYRTNLSVGGVSPSRMRLPSSTQR